MAVTIPVIIIDTAVANRKEEADAAQKTKNQQSNQPVKNQLSCIENQNF